MPLSSKEMIKLFHKKGFYTVKGEGKGSHTKVRKGNITEIIPHKRELGKGMERKLLKKLENS